VSEQVLYEHFKNYGPIQSIRVLRDSVTSASLGYAYVNFTSPVEAEKALFDLNYSKIRDRPCRIMYVNRDPSLRKSGVGNIFIKNLAKDIDHRGVHEIFSQFGPILSCRVQMDANGASKGCAFVHFLTAEAAAEAADKLNNKVVRSENTPAADVKPLKVEAYQPQQALQQRAMDTFTNMYIKNLKFDVTDEKLKTLFDQYGETSSVRVMKDGDVSKGFAFCSFKEHDKAILAIEALHDKPHEYAAEGKNLYVQRAMRRAEREKFNRQKLREKRSQYAQYTNLYVKNLDDNISTEKILSVFQPFGEIASAKVMKDPVTGFSKGFAFVSFTNAEDAKRAVKELANKAILSMKPLFVTYAQTKEERRRQLESRQRQRYTQQMDPAFGQPQMAPQAHYAPPTMQSMYPFGAQGMFPAPGMAPRQMMPPMVQPQARPMPMHPGMGGPRGPPQMMPQGPGMVPPGAVPRPGPAMPQIPGGMPIMKGPAPMITKQPVPVSAPRPGAPAKPLTSGIDHSMLASMPTEQARNILGEKLYHRITKMYPEQAAKITGMLLEMDNSEILNLLDSGDLLTQKVDEAVEVLRQHNK
jgi:polyadenylate-binding protein